MVIMQTDLPDLLWRGKVRDTFDLGGGLLLMVATDRISAFDVVLPNGIPEKGSVLSHISEFWFRKTEHLVPNHLVGLAQDMSDTSPKVRSLPREIATRAMVVKRAQRIDIECIVRGYVAGSAWAEYRTQGTIYGQPVPSGLQQGDRLPTPIFTPTTKAEVGHDENLTIQQVVDMVGVDVARQLQDLSIGVYGFAHDLALEKDTIIADTKMEFGWIDGKLTLIDELFTPDSSRFWDREGYEPGKSQPSFDKQFVRDYLDSIGWNHELPAPELPPDIVEKTSERYLEAYYRLTGARLVA